MPTSADVLASTIQDLEPGYTELFMRGLPLFSYMLGSEQGEGSSGGIEKYKLKGPYKEFTVVKGGPGSGITIRTGSETLRSQRRQQALKGNEYTTRTIYYYDVPGADLARAGGPLDMADIVDNYPENAVGDLKQVVSRQIARASSSSGVETVSVFNGINTFNGLQSYIPDDGTSRKGLFQFVAPASQTSTVHNIPMQAAASSPTTGWYHQYAHISSFGVDGMRKYREVVLRANQESAKLDGGGINLGCCDLGTFNNLLEAMGDQVVTIDKTSYPLAKHLNREGYRIGNIDVYYDPDIDITDTTSFSTAATVQLGVFYLLNTSYMQFFYQGNHADMAGSGFFDMQQYVPIPDQDAFQYRIVSDFNWFCRSLRNQACLTGGAVE